MKRRLPDGLPLASWLALGAASMLFASALWSALRIAPLPDATNGSAVLALDSLTRDGAIEHAAPIALASDPFNADRGLADDAEPEAAAPDGAAPPPPAAEVRLLGTVVRGSSPFALCQLSSDVPRIVHVGEQVGELTLISLDQGRAIFRARNGKQVELSLAKSGT